MTGRGTGIEGTESERAMSRLNGGRFQPKREARQKPLLVTLLQVRDCYHLRTWQPAFASDRSVCSRCDTKVGTTGWVVIQISVCRWNAFGVPVSPVAPSLACPSGDVLLTERSCRVSTRDHGLSYNKKAQGVMLLGQCLLERLRRSASPVAPSLARPRATDISPAVTYSPTHLRTQYHRR